VRGLQLPTHTRSVVESPPPPKERVVTLLITQSYGTISRHATCDSNRAIADTALAAKAVQGFPASRCV
jgi:hypothetical protein